jgi:transcriptional regulator with XRE-family HTH domain
MTTPSPQNELGRAIRIARRAANLSQSETAAALGVRQSSVSQWERGITLPKTRHLLQLLMLFGTRLTRLLIPEETAAGAGGADRKLAAGRTPAPPPDPDAGGSSQPM